MVTMPRPKKVKDLESLAELKTPKAEEKESKAGEENKKPAEQIKVRIKKIVCRAEGTFLPNRAYTLDSELAETLVKHGQAEKIEEK